MKPYPDNCPRRGALALLFALASPLVVGQPALEETMVSASGRKSPLLQTPASLTAFGIAQRERLGIEGPLDLAAHTPSLSITPFKVSIRGVGRPNNALGSDPGVAIYWDGVYNTENGVFNYARFLDIERIEVLRGPQGTVHGHNAIGGAIHLVSIQPGPTWRGKVVAEVTNYDGTLLQGLASGPITDHTSILAAVSHIRRDGFQENIHNRARYEQDDTLYGTFSMKHVTTDRWVTNVKLLGVDQDFRPSNGYTAQPYSRDYVQQIRDVDSGELLNFPGLFAQQNFANMHQGLGRENPAVGDVNKVSLDFSPHHASERQAALLGSEYFGDSYSIKYTGSWSHYNYSFAADADGTAAEDSGLDWRQLLLLGVPVSSLTGYELTPAHTVRRVEQEASFVSQELQYISNWSGRFSLLGGLYYYRSQEDQVISYREWNDELMATYAYFAGLSGKSVSDNNYLYRGEADLVTRSTAVYGQLQWDWTEHTALSFGLRYSRDKKDGGDNTFAQFVGDPADPTVFRERRDSWSEPTWRLGLDHLFAQQHFVYAALATGYRPGGFNFQKPTDSPVVETVDPEHLLSFELGYKGRLWRDRLNLAASAYYYDFEDMQVLVQDVAQGVGLNTYLNADDASAVGLELELMALLTPDLILGAAWSYNETEYGKFFVRDGNACALGPLAQGRGQAALCQQDRDLTGNDFPLTPDHKLSLNLTYQWQLVGMSWSATGSYLYNGAQSMAPFNDERLDRVGSWQRWDARVAARSASSAWEATVFVKNIGNDRELVLRNRPSTVTHVASADLTQPRVYGLRVDYRF